MRLVAALAVAGAFAVGCTSGSSTAPEPLLPTNPAHAQLLKAADLDPCPPSTTATVSGGLPVVTLPCLGAGPAVHLAGVRGLPMVVNVWGSWCENCQRETPYMARAYDRLKGRVRFLGVDDEDRVDSALDFAAHVRPRMRYPSVVDENKQVVIGLRGPVAVPMTVFVRPDGTVAHTTVAPYDGLAPLLADIARYLGVRA